ncbi:50S ribosomal protein L14e [Candidatus Bathyarchaeota archaeon]|nr:50S ribosomal protein L14e [Candidatus Bathyarchaeota archaeon]RLI38528.1 MAG: 50S ribosomal protein L14e [Candidatus Bathyarchaeota archaeon]
MSAIQVGRICVKMQGREAGKRCVIVEVIDESFVLVTGPKAVSGVKRRRANVKHLQPLEDILQISKGASEEEIIDLLDETGKTDYMKSS